MRLPAEGDTIPVDREGGGVCGFLKAEFDKFFVRVVKMRCIKGLNLGDATFTLNVVYDVAEGEVEDFSIFTGDGSGEIGIGQISLSKHFEEVP